MDSEELKYFKKVVEETGLTINWKLFEKRIKELEEELEKAREFRRRMADWKYIESRPEPLKTALKVLVETGDLKKVSYLYSIPLDTLNEERIKARIPIVVV